MVPSPEALVHSEGSLSFFIASLLRKAGIGGKTVHVVQKAVKSFLPGGSVFEHPAHFCQTENKEACQKERNQEKEEKDFREWLCPFHRALLTQPGRLGRRFALWLCLRLLLALRR